MKKIPNGLKIALIYGSVFLGAGFASGQELFQYFVSFGKVGVLGLMVAGVLFALTGWAVLRICRREGLENYHQLMGHLFGKKLGMFMESMVAVFLFCLFIAMLAGAGATGQEAFSLPFTFGAALVGAVVFVILCFGIQGIIKVNLLLAPFMLIGGVFIGLFSFFAHTHPAFAGVGAGMGVAWLFSAIVYASYNLVTGVPILAATAKMVSSKKDAAVGGLVGGAIITFLGLCMALPLFLHHRNIVDLEIPFLYIVLQHGVTVHIVYLVVLILAILTTAACNAFGFIQWLNVRSKNKYMPIMICLTGVVLAHIGFSNIVKYVYPAFGLLGIFKIIVVLVQGFCYTKP